MPKGCHREKYRRKSLTDSLLFLYMHIPKTCRHYKLNTSSCIAHYRYHLLHNTQFHMFKPPHCHFIHHTTQSLTRRDITTPSLHSSHNTELGKTSIMYNTLFIWFSSLTHEIEAGLGAGPLKARLAGSDSLKWKHQTQS